MEEASRQSPALTRQKRERRALMRHPSPLLVALERNFLAPHLQPALPVDPPKSTDRRLAPEGIRLTLGVRDSLHRLRRHLWRPLALWQPEVGGHLMNRAPSGSGGGDIER